MKYLLRALLVMTIPLVATGCVSIAEINAAAARIDIVWELDYQKSEDEFRHRVIDAKKPEAFEAARKTLINLGVPITKSDFDNGVISARTIAPTPLSPDEWKEIVKKEQPRVKEIGGWFMTMPDDPSVYFINATVKLISNGQSTFVQLEYELDSPKYRAMGIQLSKRAPPLAVQLAAAKFWIGMEGRLKEIGAPAPRMRNPNERAA